MSLKQYTSLIRLGDLLFFKALITQTILLGILGLSVLIGKIYFDKSANDHLINRSFKKWESVITEAVYIQQIVSKEEMPQVDNLNAFENELKSFGIAADIKIKPCGIKSDGLPLYIGKQKLINCIFIQQDYNYIFKIALSGFFLIFSSIGVSLLVWNKAKKSMDRQFYNPLITTITLEVNKFQQIEIERSKNEAVAMLTTQVAHDIRSPLEVLKGLREEMSYFPDSTKKRIHLSINRIEEIAYNLLNTYKEASGNTPSLKPEDLLSILLSTITEKNIEFRNHGSLEIISSFDPRSFGMYSTLNRPALKSILSNLMNNSVESIFGQNGHVIISLNSSPNSHLISISDNGRGISLDIKNKLFTKGFTTKKTGNGLGLFNAKQDIEAVGGTIVCESEVGKGTTFTISLPKSEAPATFIGSIDAYKYERIIVLDDDPAFHEVWAKRLEGLESKVEHIHSVEEMLSKYQALHPKILLLSDFELMDKHLDGIDTILKLGHSEHSVLVTARNEEKAIQDRCLAAGIKLLPKSLVNFIKVFSEPSGSSKHIDASKLGSAGMVRTTGMPMNTGREGIGDGPDLVGSAQTAIILVDDDRLIHLNWKSHCKKNGLDFHGFYSIEAFLSDSSSFDKASRIYIDSNLGDGIKGEIESEKIFALGFLNLYLATGYHKDSIAKPSWIKEIYSKSPENIS